MEIHKHSKPPPPFPRPILGSVIRFQAGYYRHMQNAFEPFDRRRNETPPFR
jgi:hypothetical protein